MKKPAKKARAKEKPDAAAARLRVEGEYDVAVDYARALDTVIGACGFEYADPEIKRPNFAVSGEGAHSLRAAVVAIDEDAKSFALVDALAALGLRPATLFELVGFAETHRDVPGAIVALGSARVGTSSAVVPVVAPGAGGGRVLDTGWFEGAWPAGTRFLAIPADAPAGLGKIPHNHLLAAPKRKEPRGAFDPPCEREYRVHVDYDADTTALVKAAKLAKPVRDVSGWRDGVASGEATATLRVVHLNRVVTRADVERELRDRGLRPASFVELFSLAASAPEAFADTAVLAPRPVDGTTPALALDGKRLSLVFYPAEFRYPSHLSFAGVRER